MEEQRLLNRKTKATNDCNLTLLVAVCTDLADLYVKEGRHDLAIEEYKVLGTIHKSHNRLIEYAKAYRGIGEAYLALHNFEEALKHQTIYLNVANDQGDKLEQQRALATIGHTYLTWYLETQADPNKNLNAAYKYFMKSLMIAENLSGIDKLEKADMLARLFSNLGLVKECLGDYNKALELFDRSISICKQHDIYEQLSRSYMSVASLYEKKQEYNDAIRHYNLAIESAKKVKDKVDLMCGALMAKSEILIKLADFYSAKQVLLKAYKLKTPNIQERNMIERNLRIVATMCYTEDKLMVIYNDEKGLKTLYEKLGDAACELKIYAEAIKYYKLMLEWAQNSGVNDRELASCYYTLAETYKDNNQFVEAVEYFEKEYALCADLKDNLNTLSKIADTKEEAGAPVSEVKAVYERAFTNCRKSMSLKEERRMVSRCISYLRRNNAETDALHLDQYLSTLAQTSFEEEFSSSDSEEDSEPKGNIGDDINLNDITDNSDDSDVENQQSTSNVQKVAGKRRNKNFVIKKNPKGESQLHVACINGTEKVVRHLVETGHPINVRDYSGWLPLHEACNHGHFEIVKFLLDKGAAINDRGGTHCNGVTPLYDAANNGHLKIVKLLLDNGASATIKTDDGDTPLNILKEWNKKNPYSGDDLVLYQYLVNRLQEAMKKAGQNSKPTLLVKPSCSYRSDKENVVQMPNRYERLSRSLDSDDDDNDNIGEPPVSQLAEGEGANEYLRVMGNLRNRTSNISGSSLRVPNAVSKRPALIATKDDNKDWLEDDIQTKVVKKRKTNSISSLITTTSSTRRQNSETISQASPRKRGSFEVPADEFFMNDFEDEHMDIDDIILPNGEQRRTSNESRHSTGSTSSTSNSKRKTQASLLDAGFSRTRNNTPTFERNSSSEGTHEGNRRNPSLTRTNSFEHRNRPQQQRLTSFGHTRSIVETESTPVLSTQASVNEQVKSLAPAAGDLMVYVDVKIEEKVFRVPVLLSQVQSNTIGWLAEQAANKYARKEGTKPVLELETITGALLSDEDPLSLLFPLGATQAEPVVGRVLKLSLPSLVERYKEACSLMDTNADVLICDLLEEVSVNLNLANFGCLSDALAPLCKALNHQTTLMELDLSGNFMDTDCMIRLFSSLPTLTNLCTLNLRCTGLTSSDLAEFVKVFVSNSTPVLQKLNSLDLSDNPLMDKSLLHLSRILTHLKLTNLNLSNVKFSGNIFKEINNENVRLNFTEIECLDLSNNELGVGDIIKFISWTDASKLCVLNVSRNDSANKGILWALLDIWRNVAGGLQMKCLNLSRCNLHESELYEFLWLISERKTLTDIDLSYNPDLTGISLRRLMECSCLENIDLIGCDKILLYFDNSFSCSSLDDSDDQGDKALKMSASLEHYPAEVATLINMFKNKYSDCYMEKSDNFLYLASSKKYSWRQT